MSHASTPAGTLFVVSTPIGNLEDITLRALRVLRESHVIAAEDTRHTSRLLNHFGISTPTLSLHEHNERSRAPQLLERLAQGQHVALVTDAGTPLLSDPGLTLVRTAIEAGFRVEPIPGASAVLSALVASGISTDEFLFLGFPPNKTVARREWYRRASGFGVPFVVFEAPHRLGASLKDAREVFGPTQRVSAARELTKLHEEHVRGTLDEVIAHFAGTAPRGELTLVFEPGLNPDDKRADVPLEHSDTDIWTEFCSLTKSGLSRRAVIAELSRRLHRPAREIYAAAERGKALAKGEEDDSRSDEDGPPQPASVRTSL